MPIDPNNLSGTANLTFDDEFNSLSLWNGTSGVWSTSFWYDNSFGNGSTLAGNGEQEWYVNSNYGPTSSLKPWSVDANGIMHITATLTPASMAPYVNNYAYVSGELNSYHAFSQTYGYFEIRAKLPSGQGMWPAFWLLPEDGSWPPELDVFEVLGANPTNVITTVHTNETGVHTQFAQGNTVADTSGGFHTYGVDWEADYITWYFDGLPIYKVATPTDLNKPMYMVVNLALGGYWGGNVDATTPFPGDMQVDYIRAYASKSLAGPTPTPLIVSGAASGSGGATSATAAAPMAIGDVLKLSGAAATLANAGVMTSALLWGGKLVVAEAVDAGWGSHSAAANEFDTTGAALGSTISLTGYSAAGAAMDPVITGLTGGFWRIDYAGAGAPAAYEIYDQTGKQVFVVNQYTTGSPTFVGLLNGAYVSTSTGWGGRFAITEANSKVDWINLPTVNGVATAPTTVTALSDGGFVFSYAGSNQLDRYNFNGGVQTTLTLGASAAASGMTVIGLPAYHLAAAWVSPTVSGGAEIMVQTFDAQGAQISGAVAVAQDADPAHTELTAVPTGAGDQTMLFWSQGGFLYAAAANGAAASSPLLIGAVALDQSVQTSLTDGRVAVAWIERVGGLNHLIAEVIDPATMTGSRQDLGAADGQVRIVATGSGGFALSWHAGASVLAQAYDGQSHWGAAQAVSGDFLGLDPNGLIVAVGADVSGHATLQHYDLGADPTTTTASAPSAAPVTTISDTAANISAGIDTLNANTALTKITVSDNLAVVVSVAQLSADAHAVSELVNASGAAVSLTVTDTAANVAASLTALGSAANVGSAVVSDGLPLALNVAQLGADAAGLAKISGYTLAITDTAANLDAALDTLNANASVNRISVSDNAAVVVSVAQLSADARALSELVNASGAAVSLTVTDTAANVAASLPSLGSTANVGSVVVSDGLPLALHVAQLGAASAGLAKVASYGLAISDTAANLSSVLDSLNANTHLNRLTVSDNGALNVSWSQLNGDSRALSMTMDGNGQSWSTGLRDIASVIGANLDALTANTHVSTIAVSDGQAIQLNLARLTSDAAGLAKISGAYALTVADTGAKLSASLSSLQANSHVGSLIISDGASLSLTAAQFSADATVLAKVAGAHTVNVTGFVNTSYGSERLIYDGTNHLSEQILNNNNGSLGVNVYSPGVTVSPTSQVETVTLSSTLDKVQFGIGFGNATVKGYTPGADEIDISKQYFGSFFQMMNHASQSLAGVTIHAGGHAILLAGQTLSLLSAHSSDFHFI